MADEKKYAHAKEVYDSLCRKLERDDWKFSRDDGKMIINFMVGGEDIPMSFIMLVDVERQVLRVLSQMPFKFPEDKRIEGAIATCVATNGLADGSFDYDIASGEIWFRQTVAFMDSEIGDDMFGYLIWCASTTVDRYNDRFLAVSKGIMSIGDFIAKD